MGRHTDLRHHEMSAAANVRQVHECSRNKKKKQVFRKHVYCIIKK